MRLHILFLVFGIVSVSAEIAIAQQQSIKTGTYNAGSRYITIQRKGNRICYQGISFPPGRYAVAVGETTGSLSYKNGYFVIDGWKKYGKTVTLVNKGKGLLITHDSGWSIEYDYFQSDGLGGGYSNLLVQCLNAGESFFETHPGYSIQSKQPTSKPTLSVNRTQRKSYIEPNSFSLEYPINWTINRTSNEYVIITNYKPSRSSGSAPPQYIKIDAGFIPESYESLVSYHLKGGRGSSPVIRYERTKIGGREAYQIWFGGDGYDFSNSVSTFIYYNKNKTAFISSYYSSSNINAVKQIQFIHNSFRILK
jgi:PsbP-like protein